MKSAGYEAITQAGKAEKPVSICVKDDKAGLRDGGALRGKDACKAVKRLGGAEGGPMRVTVKLYGYLRKYKPEVPRGGALSVDIPPGTTVRQVLEQLAIPNGVRLVTMVSSGVCRLDHTLVEGDQLMLFPPVAGG
jgi:molybdopterin converting factor small subunit